MLHSPLAAPFTGRCKLVGGGSLQRLIAALQAVAPPVLRRPRQKLAAQPGQKYQDTVLSTCSPAPPPCPYLPSLISTLFSLLAAVSPSAHTTTPRCCSTLNCFIVSWEVDGAPAAAGTPYKLRSTWYGRPAAVPPPYNANPQMYAVAYTANGQPMMMPVAMGQPQAVAVVATAQPMAYTTTSAVVV